MTTERIGQRQAPLNLRIYEVGAVVPLLPRLRCGACRGKIALEPPTLTPGVLYCLDCAQQFNEVVDKLSPRGPLPPEEARQKRSRRPRPKSKPRPQGRRQQSCTDCSVRMVRTQRGRTRCYECAMARIRSDGVFGRLMELLRTTEPMRTVHLAAMLGCQPCVVRKTVQKARARGVPIVTVKWRYRLAEQAS